MFASISMCRQTDVYCLQVYQIRWCFSVLEVSLFTSISDRMVFYCVGGFFTILLYSI